MSFTFPASPAVDDTIELNGKTFKWTANNTWDRVTSTTSSETSSSVYTFASTDITFDNTFVYNHTSSVTGIFWGDDGNTLFITGLDDNITGYPATTPYDITSTSYSSLTNQLSVAAQNGFQEDLFFSSDGTKMFMLGSFGTTNHAVFGYDLSTAWDLNTATYSNNTYNVNSTAGGAVGGLAFNTDGTIMYAVSGTNIWVYPLATAWDLTSVSSSTSYDYSAQGSGNLSAIRFNSDGTQMYMTDLSGKFWINDLSTGFDVSTYTFNSSYDIKTDVNYSTAYPYGFDITPDSTKLHVSFYASGYQRIWSWTLAPTASTSTSGGSTSARTHYQPDFYSMQISNWIDNVDDTTLFGANISAAKKLRFADNGNKMLVTAIHTDSVYLLDMSTPYDPSTMTYDGVNTFNASAQEATPYNSKISPDGLNLYIGGNSGDDINQYSLSTAFDLTTATFVANQTVKGVGIHLESSFNNFDMSDDGTKVFIGGTGKDTVSSLTLSTPWDITTMTSDDGVWQGMDPYSGTDGLSVAPDGMTMWAQSPGDASFKYAQQWVMDSAWDIGSATPAGVWMMLPYYYRNSTNSPGETANAITDATRDNQNFYATLWHPTEKKLWFYHGAYTNYFTEVTWS